MGLESELFMEKIIKQLFMSDIMQVKKQEMQKIIDFYYKIEDYGHIFHLDNKLLDVPFKKILEGIEEINKMMDDSYSI